MRPSTEGVSSLNPRGPFQRCCQLKYLPIIRYPRLLISGSLNIQPTIIKLNPDKMGMLLVRRRIDPGIGVSFVLSGIALPLKEQIGSLEALMDK